MAIEDGMYGAIAGRIFPLQSRLEMRPWAKFGKVCAHCAAESRIRKCRSPVWYDARLTTYEATRSNQHRRRARRKVGGAVIVRPRVHLSSRRRRADSWRRRQDGPLAG